MDIKIGVALSMVRVCSTIMAQYCTSPASNDMPPVVAWVVSETLKNAMKLVAEEG